MVQTRRQAKGANESPAKPPPDFTTYRSQESPSSGSETSDGEVVNEASAGNDSTAPTSAGSESVGSDRTWGVPLWVQKKFLVEIERRGGLRSASVREVCNSDPINFGKPGSDRRRQIRNRVNTLKGWGESEYYTFLQNLEVPTYAHQQRILKSGAPSTPRKQGRSTPRKPSASQPSRATDERRTIPLLEPQSPSALEPAVLFTSPSSTMALSRPVYSRPSQFATVIEHDPSMDSEVRARVLGT
jgi:hypothetical protein